MVLLLCTGPNPSLARTRQILLERARHAVVAAINEEAILAACKKSGIEVAVLCQRLSRELKRKASALLHEHCPSARILELYEANDGRQLADADAWLEVPPDDPNDLADHVAALLPPEKKKARI